MRLSQTERQLALDLVCRLINIPSPYFQEAEIMAYAHSRAQALGLPAKIHHYQAELFDFNGQNLYGQIDGQSDGPFIYLGGHLDTVNVAAGWQRDPLSATQEGNRLYGTGALDMKSGCSAILMALHLFLRDFPRFKGCILYHLASVEEGPYGLGTTHFLKDILHDTPDFGLITEPSSALAETEDMAICLGAMGGYQYTIELHGLSAHAATPDQGISALDEAARLVQLLNRIEGLSHPVMGQAASCVIGLQAGSGACSVPDKATIEVFRHIVPGETRHTIEQEIKAAIARAKLRCDSTITFRPAPAEGFDGGFAPFYTDPENHYVGRLSHLIEQYSGRPPVMSFSKAIGDFNLLGGQRRIPTVLFGASGGRIHQPDEYLDIESYYRLIEVLYAFLKDSLVD